LQKFETRWPAEDFGPREHPTPAKAGELVNLEQAILGLAPRDETQKWFQSQALQLASGLAAVQWLLMNQELGDGLPTPILIVLTTWSTAIFISFGLFVKPNPTVITALSISALAVAGAMFLILELNSPFAGLMQVSPAPAHALLAVLSE